jgi:hypothetical protein
MRCVFYFICSQPERLFGIHRYKTHGKGVIQVLYYYNLPSPKLNYEWHTHTSTYKWFHNICSPVGLILLYILMYM